MALDAERQHTSPGGGSMPHSPESAPSPPARPTNGHAPPSQPQQPMPHMARTLKFSIENILRPDFGKGAVDRREPDRSSPADTPASKPLGTAGNAATPPAILPDPTKPDEFPKPMIWPAWVYCTRYSDRPSSGAGRRRRQSSLVDDDSPRSRRMKKKDKKPEEKRPRTAFTNEQLARLKKEFQENRYLTEKRRQDLARELKLNESQIKIWFQNKRAKIKKASGQRNGLALQLMAQGLYNHSTIATAQEEQAAKEKKK